MPVHQDLAGRTAIVTGANHGIGAATAVALAARGASVLLSYLRMPASPDPSLPDRYHRVRREGAEVVLGAVKAAGGIGHAVEADLADPQSPALLFDSAEARFGPVDILVNNASGWLADTFKAHTAEAHTAEAHTEAQTLEAGGADRYGRTLAPVTAETFDRMFAVDARGGALMIAEFARRHLARGASWGRIISLTSGDGGGFPEEVSYGAAKAALTDYTLSAARELISCGVTANVVHPPITDTGWVTEDVRRAVSTDPRLGRIAEPAEVGEAIAHLVSDPTGLITSSVIRLT